MMVCAIKKTGNKGQVLVITALIVVLVLFLIKVEITYLGDNEFSETGNLNTFNNLKNELKRSGEITIWEDNYTMAYEFSDFVTDQKDSEIFYSIVDFDNPGLNVTVVNFLDEDIGTVTISQNLTDETDVIPVLTRGSSDYVNFTSYESSETPFHVNITYTGSSSGNLTISTFTAAAGPGRHVTVFHLLKLNYGGSYLEDKFSVAGKTS